MPSYLVEVYAASTELALTEARVRACRAADEAGHRTARHGTARHGTALPFERSMEAVNRLADTREEER